MGSHGIDRDPRHRLMGNVDVPGGIGTGSPARFNPGGIAGLYARVLPPVGAWDGVPLLIANAARAAMARGQD